MKNKIPKIRREVKFNTGTRPHDVKKGKGKLKKPKYKLDFRDENDYGK